MSVIKKTLLILFIFLMMTAGTLFAQDDTLYLQIREGFYSGDYEKTIQQVQDILSRDTSRIDLLDIEVKAGLNIKDPTVYINNANTVSENDYISIMRKALINFHLGYIKITEDLLNSLPDHNWKFYYLGRLAFYNDENRKAIDFLTKAKADSLSYPLALFKIGDIYQLEGKFALSDSLLNESKKYTPVKFESLINLIWNIGYRGEWKKALQQAEQFLLDYPEPYVYSRVAGIYSSLNNYKRENEILAEAIKQWPENKDIISAYAFNLSMMGRFDQNLELTKDQSPIHHLLNWNVPKYTLASDLNDTLMLQQAFKELTTNQMMYPYSYINFIDWLEKRNRKPEADSIFQSVSSGGTKNFTYRIHTYKTRSENPSAALKLLDSLYPEYPNMNMMFAEKIILTYKAGDINLYNELVDRFLENSPGKIPLLIDLAELQAEYKHYNTALKFLDKVDALVDNCRSADLLRTRIYIDQGREKKEIKALLDKILADYPDYHWLLWYYRRIDNFELTDETEKVISQFDKRENNSISYYKSLTFSFPNIKQADQGITVLTSLLETYPNAAELYFYRGVLKETAADINGALEDYKKAQELDPFKEFYSKHVNSSTMNAVTYGNLSSQTAFDSTGLQFISLDSIQSLSRLNLESAEDNIIYLLDKYQHFILPSLKSFRRSHHILKILKKEAIEEYTTMSFWFSAYKEKPYVIRARTIQEDGTTVDIESDQIFISTADGSSSSDSKLLQLHFPGIHVGSTLEMIVQFEKEYEEMDDIYAAYQLSKTVPVAASEVEFQLPKNWNIIDVKSNKVQLLTKENDVSRTYKWTLNNIPALISESYAPHYWEQCQWLEYSYDKTWKKEADFYWNKISDKFIIDDDIKKLVKNITTDKKTEEEKLAACFDYVTSDIRYNAILFGEGSVIPRTADQILKNKYGDCKDKATLLITMLKALEIEGHPALISDNDTIVFTKEIPDFIQFNHMIVYIPTFDLFVDPTCEFCEYNEIALIYKNKPTLIIGSNLENPLLTTPPAVSSDESYYRSIRFAPQTNGILNLDLESTYKGYDGVNLKSYFRSTSDSITLFNTVKEYAGVGLWKTAKMIDYQLIDIDKPGRVCQFTSRFEVDSMFLKSYDYTYGNFWFYSLYNFLSIPDTIGRKLDFDIGYKFEVHEKITYVPGELWELDDNIISWDISNEWFTTKNKFTHWDDSFMIEISYKQLKERIACDDLPEFIKAVQSVQDRIMKQSPLFRRTYDRKRAEKLQAFIDENPDDVTTILALSDLYLGNDQGGQSCRGFENREKVRNLLQKVYDKDPSNEVLLMRLLTLLLADELNYEADSLLSRYYTVAQNPSPYVELMGIGIHGSLVKWDKVAENIDRLLLQFPVDIFRVLQVKAHTEVGDLPHARKILDQMELLEIDSTILLQAKFEYYLSTKEYNKAEELVAHWPDTNRVVLLGIRTGLYQVQEKYQQAYEDTYEILKSDPYNSIFLNNAAWFAALSGLDLNLALERANTAIALQGNCNTGFLNTRGLIYLKMNRVKEAKADFLAALSNQTASSLTINYYFLGECALAENNKEKAIQYYQLVMEIKGDNWSINKASERLKELGAN